MLGLTMPKLMACTRCLERDFHAKRVTKGSFLLEIGLWLLLIVPGLIYSVWRTTSRYLACPACGSSEIVPEESERARRMAR